MIRTMRSIFTPVAALLLALPVAAEEEYEVKWSASIEAVVKRFISSVDDDDVTGFFDLYEYTSGKSAGTPVQLGLSELVMDVLGSEETPVLQFRFLSPTSNLNLTGSNDTPFLNQRAELLARPEGIALDVDYWRLRTDELRLFPTPISDPCFEFPCVYNDDTSPGDRFYTQRTGFRGEIRLRPGDLFPDAPGEFTNLVSEISIRGGYDKRDGNRQYRYLLDGTDIGAGADGTVRWRGLNSEIDQRVSDAGGGVVLTPGGWFTLTLDVDAENFRNDASTFLQSEIGDPPVAALPKTINFIPDTDRITGTARLHRRFGERALLYGGFQGATLRQAGDETPAQTAAGLTDNEVRFYSANAGADVNLSEAFSLNTYFKYDYRDNRIQRDTLLFNPLDGSQVDPFLDDLQEIGAGAEIVYRPRSTNLVALGYRGLWIDRTLDFASTDPPPNRVIEMDNSVIDRDTTENSVYLRGRTRPVRSLNLSGEVGYRNAPKTGYIRELSRAVYFKFRSSYSAPIERSLIVSLTGSGVFGKNDDFTQISQGGTAEDQSRDFERNDYSYGVTVSHAPLDAVTLYAAFYQYRDTQDFDLVRSTFPRYWEPIPPPVDFRTDNPLDYRADLTNILFGSTLQATKRTSVTVSYSFTASRSKFDADNSTAAVFRPASLIDSNIHSVETLLGHWLTESLRVYAGYRFDKYKDYARVPPGTGSVVPSFDLSTHQHTITFGVTLTNAAFGSLSARM